jgi:hypothetical protein
MQDHGSVDSVFTLTVYASCLDAEDVREERRDWVSMLGPNVNVNYFWNY